MIRVRAWAFLATEGKNWGAEYKYAEAPRITRSMTTIINDLDFQHLWVVYPGKKTYRLSEKITVLSHVNSNLDFS